MDHNAFSCMRRAFQSPRGPCRLPDACRPLGPNLVPAGATKKPCPAVISAEVICPSGRRAKTCPAPSEKIFLFLFFRNRASSASSCSGKRGASADRHETRGRMRWTLWLAATIAGESGRAKSCGPGLPTLRSSGCETFRKSRRWLTSPAHRGEHV